MVDEVIVRMYHLNPLVFQIGDKFSERTEMKPRRLLERYNFHPCLNERRDVD
jgi:hypothetical protein